MGIAKAFICAEDVRLLVCLLISPLPKLGTFGLGILVRIAQRSHHKAGRLVEPKAMFFELIMVVKRHVLEGKSVHHEIEIFDK